MCVCEDLRDVVFILTIRCIQLHQCQINIHAVSQHFLYSRQLLMVFCADPSIPMLMEPLFPETFSSAPRQCRSEWDQGENIIIEWNFFFFWEG